MHIRKLFSLVDVISNQVSCFTFNIIFMNDIVGTGTLKTKLLWLACVVLCMLVLMASIGIGLHYSKRESLFLFLKREQKRYAHKMTTEQCS